jgi:hypothetical protein
MNSLVLANVSSNIAGFVKSPSAALRFTFVVVAYLVSTPHSSGFARLASGAFYFAIVLRPFYEIINIRNKESASRTSCRFSLSCLNLEEGEELQNQI